MPEAIILVMVLVGAALAFGLLKFVPGIKAIGMILGWVAAFLLIGLALGALGYTWLINLISGIEWLYALVVGLLAGTIFANLFGR